MQWKTIGHRFKEEFRVYRLVLQDDRTPKFARWLLGIALAYALSPIDLIPDFVPILGHLDDLVIVPLLIIIAVKLIPPSVIDDCRLKSP
jgi:uncharacterized membrane protein YkvA (DUF1232 family)